MGLTCGEAFGSSKEEKDYLDMSSLFTCSTSIVMSQVMLISTDMPPEFHLSAALVVSRTHRCAVYITYKTDHEFPITTTLILFFQKA